MRSFIGINFTKEIKENITGIQKQVRDSAIRGRFKHVDNFHITLKFLGEISMQQPAKIAEKLAEIAMRNEAFELRLQEIGCFKGRDNIRTLYLGLGGYLEALLKLNADVESAMLQLGFPREARPYTPHITIAQDLSLKIPFEQLKKQIDMSAAQTICVDKIMLIKSEQQQNKRIYTPVYSYELSNVKA